MAGAAKARRRATTYQAHRDRQTRRILDAASKLFDRRGIDRVTMAEITAASGLQPSTIYRYFSSKNDIVWAIVGELMLRGSRVATESMKNTPNALARIRALLETLADQLSRHAEEVRFMAQFDAMYARDWPVERLLSLESQIHPEPFRFLNELVREGIRDGSLRAELDPDLTMHAVINAVVGAQRRLAALGKKVEKEYGKPVDELLRESIRVLLLGLQGPGTPPCSGKTASTRRTALSDKKRNRKRPS